MLARVCRTLAPAFCPAAHTEHPRPCRTCKPSFHPRTVGGPAMQAPTSERQGLRENISQFCNFIVGASIARPLKPCAAARPPGWSKAPPPQYTARECVKFLSPFCNSTVGAGLGSARVCRTLALAFCPAAHTEHPRPCRTRKPSFHPRTVGGPAMQAPTSKRQGSRKNTPALSYYIVGASIARPPLPNAGSCVLPRSPHRTPSAHTAAANPQILTPHS